MNKLEVIVSKRKLYIQLNVTRNASKRPSLSIKKGITLWKIWLVPSSSKCRIFEDFEDFTLHSSTGNERVKYVIFTQGKFKILFSIVAEI